MLKKRNQKGFTLIEIIAVLVILGILAAVAIPKFLNLQDEARVKAVEGAIAAGASQLSMQYASGLLNGSASATSWTFANTAFPLGDFEANLTGACGNLNSTVQITNAAPSWWNTYTGKTNQTYTICGS